MTALLDGRRLLRGLLEGSRRVLRVSERSQGTRPSSSARALWLAVSAGFLLLTGKGIEAQEAVSLLCVGVIALAATAFHISRASPGGRSSRLLAVGSVVLGLGGLFASSALPIRLFCYALWSLGLSLWPTGDARRREAIWTAARGSVLGAALVTLVTVVPLFRFLLDRFSMVVSGWLNRPLGGSALGSSAAGLVPLLLILCFSLTRGRPSRRRAFVGVLRGLVLLFAGHLVAQGLVTTTLAHSVTRIAYVSVSLLLVAFSRDYEHSEEQRTPRRASPIPVACAATFLLAGVLVIAGLPTWSPRHLETASPRGVLIWDHTMLGTWSAPPDIAPGLAFSSATFGLLAEYLSALGWKTERLTDELTTDRLTGMDLLVVINPGAPFSNEEVRLVRDFVGAGHALLAMGDHTNMAGLMDNLNGLLLPFRVGLADDSAISMGNEGWAGKLDVTYPLGSRYGAQEVPVSVGASVWAKPGPLIWPLLVGRDAFSDPANHKNVQGALLGNMRFDRGEDRGDVLLAVMRTYGRGSVTVFGDTSVFQNRALASAHEYVSALLGWAVPGPRGWMLVLAELVGLGFLAMVAVSLSRPTARPFLVAIYVAVAIVGLAGAGTLSARATAPQRLQAARVAYVDFTHGNLIQQTPLSPDGADGLVVSLSRNGYLPAENATRLVNLPLKEDDVFVCLAPTVAFSRQDVIELRDFLERGGLVFLSAGIETASRISPLVGPLGAALVRMPLGEVVSDASSPLPQAHFVSAWPLRLSADWTPIATVELGGERFTTAAWRGVGSGKLVLVGDEAFLLTKNLEGREQYWAENVAFLRELLLEARKP
jgi:hypothetical protein